MDLSGGTIMKPFLLACALLAGSAFPAMAQVWQGDAFIVKITPACKTNGWAVGDFFRTVMSPANVGENDANSRLSLYGARVAQRFFMQNQALAGNGTYTGTFITSRAGFLSWTNGTFSGARIKPAATPTTQTLSLNIKVARFSDLDGCTVTLEGSLNLRPE
jgi:hypothetical protein